MGESGRYPAKAGVGFLGLSVTAILFLTLMPVPEWQWETEKRFSLCILCTAGAVPDFFENALLFLPVGAALAFRRQRLWATVLYGALLSLAIEMMQLGVPGRDPSLQDVASNTLGTFFGFGIAHSPFGPPVVRALDWFRDISHECRRPSPKLATVLVCAALLVTTGVLALTGWLRKPAFPPGPYLFAGQELDEGATPLRIGANDNQDGFFKGVIDEVRIYNRALAPDEIQGDMARAVGDGSASSAPGLVAAYGFEEADGDKILDASRQGNSGLLDGAVRVAGRFGNALKYDGRGAQVIISPTRALNLSSGFTIQAWISPEPSASTWPTVIQKEKDLYFLYAGAYGALVPRGGGTFGAANQGVNALKPLAYGSWSHLATSYDGSALRMYVNGRLVANRVRWFQGRIDHMSVGSTEVRPGLVDTRWLTDALEKGEVVQVRGTAAPPMSDRGPILNVRNICNECADKDILILAAHHDDLIVQSFSTSSALGLPSPEVRFHGVLAGISAESPLKIALSGTPGERSLTVNGAIYREGGFSLGMGWTAFIFAQYLPEWLSNWLNLLWVWVWTFPIGFWSRTRRVFVGAVVIFGSVIWWLPAFAGFAPTPLIQWVAVGVGLLMGIGTHRLMGMPAKGGSAVVVSS